MQLLTVAFPFPTPQTPAFISRSPTYRAKSQFPSSRNSQWTRTCTQMRRRSNLHTPRRRSRSTISRTGTGEVLFTIADHPLIFEPQYLQLKTTLPPKANIYGLGEHSEPFRLDEMNTTRTMWSRDGVWDPSRHEPVRQPPCASSLRQNPWRLLSSSGMHVKIRGDGESATSLEYHIIGGIFDFYFLAGRRPILPRSRGGMHRSLGHLLRSHIGHLVCINAGTGIKVRFSFVFRGCERVTGK